MTRIQCRVAVEPVDQEGRGYARRGPFANYKPDPLSIFMEKKLATARQSR
jgi:hypothetical protein